MQSVVIDTDIHAHGCDCCYHLCPLTVHLRFFVVVVVFLFFHTAGAVAGGSNSDTITLFSVWSFSRKATIYGTAGIGVGFLILIACCYQAVTYTSENEDVPGPSEELLKKQKKVNQIYPTQVQMTAQKHVQYQ